jgi:hypothetical protein
MIWRRERRDGVDGVDGDDVSMYVTEVQFLEFLFKLATSILAALAPSMIKTTLSHLL